MTRTITQVYIHALTVAFIYTSTGMVDTRHECLKKKLICVTPDMVFECKCLFSISVRRLQCQGWRMESFQDKKVSSFLRNLTRKYKNETYYKQIKIMMCSITSKMIHFPRLNQKVRNKNLMLLAVREK